MDGVERNVLVVRGKGKKEEEEEKKERKRKEKGGRRGKGKREVPRNNRSLGPRK